MIGTICVWLKDWQSDYDNFQKNLSSYEKVCVLGSIEADPDRLCGSNLKLQSLVSLCKSHRKNITILTAAHSDDQQLFDIPYNIADNKIKIEVIYWPTFWLALTFTRLCVGEPYRTNSLNNLNIEDLYVGKDYEMEYTFLSMNGVPKKHRCILQDFLAKNNLLEYGKYSWRNISKGSWYAFKYWDIGKKTILLDQPDTLFNQEILPAVYSNCFMQIVPETHENKFCLSEKTSMPLFFNKPFLVAGSAGFHQKLKNMGFELYDELFDYSFDSEESLDKRYEMITENIKPYTKLDKQVKKSLYKKIFDKCVYNKKLALKYATDINSFPNIWNELDSPIYDHLQHVNPYHLNKILVTKKQEFGL